MKKMLFLVFALVLFSWSQASADSYSFSYIGPAINASGTLNAVSNGDGSYTATSGSGLANGFAITLLLNPNVTAQALSPGGGFLYDNQLFPTANPLISNNGLLFTAAYSPKDGTSVPSEVNLFSEGAGVYTYFENYPTAPYQEYGTFTLTGGSENGDPTNAVPEPLSLLFLGFGLVGIVGAKSKLKK